MPTPVVQVQLTRWDLFHAHCFVTPKGRGLGMLFHAKEYPRMDAQAFPYNLGYCQRGSPLGFDARAMDLRNLLFYKVGRLAFSVAGLFLNGRAVALCSQVV